jgi:SNF2 family DNA or RNA helicase
VSRVFEPHPYQHEAIQHLYSTPRAALWMPMGGGKTVSTLTALNDLSLVEDVFPVLVLAPLRVAKTTWPEEVAKWDHLAHLRVSVVTGSAKERQSAICSPADIYACNYDNLQWLVEELGDAWPFKTVIADEFTRLKSFRIRQGSKRAGALGKVAHTKVRRFIGLTGTPSPNGLQDLWGQTWFLDQGQRLGRTYSAFADRWFSKGYDGYSLKPLPTAQADIEARLKDICLTVNALPVDEPVHNQIRVDLPPAARKLYRDMEKEMFLEIEEQGVEALNAAAKTLKCLQLANGAVYTDDQGSWSGVHDAKLEALDSVLEEAAGAPVLVAYHFKSDLQRLLKAFPKARVLDKDPKTIAQWNRGEIPLLLAHPASAGHGLNLADGGNILVFFSLNWNLEEHMQIIERIGPLRQKQAGHNRPVFVHYIMARQTVDSMVLERLRSKKTVQEVLVEAMKRKQGVAQERKSE